jgi:hypothetical protein
MRAEVQPSFNGGELSARMEGRSDLAVYGVAGREIRNMIVTVQGPAVKRPGTAFTARTKSAAQRVQLIPFIFNVTQAYQIEAGPGYFRFFTNDVQIESAPGVPYEIASPYTAADIAALDREQSRDVLYLFCRGHETRELRRTSAVTFELVEQPRKNGPFKDQNSDDSKTIGASAGTGTVTLTANFPAFLPGHVGSLLELEAQDFRSIPAWEPQVKVLVGNKRRSEGKVYEVVSLPASGSERTGTIQPTHTEGDEWDGTSAGEDINEKDSGGVLWRYLYSRAGQVRITAVGSPTSATATVLKRLPDELVTTPTRRWAFGLYSAVEGFPTNGRIRDERLYTAKDFDIAASVVGDYNDFAPRDETGTVQPDLGFRIRTPSPNLIQWLANDIQLLIGTASGEYAAVPVNAGQAISAENIRIPAQSFHGSERVRPVQAGSRTLFVARTGRKLREAGFDDAIQRYRAQDMMVRSSHLGAPGFVELAWQAEPEALVWALRADGKLACLTYDEDQDVRAWTSHDVGGFVESIATIPSPDNSHDQLWLAVRRTVNGQTVRFIERLERWWQEGDALPDAFFVDCGLRYSGAPATTIGGLGHLAGETVWVLADGAAHPDREVSPSGTITLQRAASKVAVGLPFTARITTMQLNPQAPEGSSQSKIKRVVKVAFRFLETLGVRFGAPTGRKDNIEFRTSAMVMDGPPELFSGDEMRGFPGGFERDARMTIESFQPLPFTLLSMAPRMLVSGEE